VLRKGSAVENSLSEENGAVKLECQECGTEWLRPAGSSVDEGGWMCVDACNRSHCESGKEYNNDKNDK
jgi:hypothetical protein